MFQLRLALFYGNLRAARWFSCYFCFLIEKLIVKNAIMLPKQIDIKAFHYDLPEDRIASFPAEPRDTSKLLKLEKGIISHHIFRDIADLLPKESMLVFNQTRVIQARLFLTKETGTRIEVLLLEPIFPSTEVVLTMGAQNSVVWECMIGNKKRWKEGEIIAFNGVEFSWADRSRNHVRISWSDSRVFAELLSELGKMPIPPYIKRESIEKDKEIYQTVYARNDGSVAAPTAGLHFTEYVLDQLHKKEIETEFITLHVGAGTFKPVSTENALEHEMHSEKMFFTKDNLINLMKHKGKIIPVGTTSMRSLESLYWFGAGLHYGKLNNFHIPQYFPYEFDSALGFQDSIKEVLNYMSKNNLDNLQGLTSIYIVPGYQFRVCEGIITNFHQPASTLMLLVSALIGEQWREVYAAALENNYRFLSFGDSSLLLP